MVKQVREFIASFRDHLQMIEEEKTMKTEEVNAVYSEDMIEFLESLGILHKVKNGKKRCYYCNKSTHINNISSVFPAKNEVQICCDSYDCYKQILGKDISK